MQICSALLTNNSDRLESGDVSSESSDIGPCVMCVARRIPHNEKPITTAIQQFTVKLDPSGKILALDNSWLSQSYSTYLNKVNFYFNSFFPPNSSFHSFFFFQFSKFFFSYVFLFEKNLENWKKETNKKKINETKKELRTEKRIQREEFGEKFTRR